MTMFRKSHALENDKASFKLSEKQLKDRLPFSFVSVMILTWGIVLWGGVYRSGKNRPLPWLDEIMCHQSRAQKKGFGEQKNKEKTLQKKTMLNTL